MFAILRIASVDSSRSSWIIAACPVRFGSSNISIFAKSADREASCSQLIKMCQERTGKAPSPFSTPTAQQGTVRPGHEYRHSTTCPRGEFPTCSINFPTRHFPRRFCPRFGRRHDARLDTLGDLGSQESLRLPTTIGGDPQLLEAFQFATATGRTAQVRRHSGSEPLLCGRGELSGAKRKSR